MATVAGPPAGAAAASSSSASSSASSIVPSSSVVSTETKDGKTKTMVNGVEVVVSSRYKILRSIGSGAYGIVVSALDTAVEPPVKVAIKIIKNNYKDLVDAKRILREIKLLRFFGRHENIVELYDLDEPLEGVDAEDVTIVTGLMETDLHRVIYSRQKLSDDHGAYFLYQLLRGLKFMHSANIIHRDLKPSNILLNSNCDLRICDLGLARGIYEVEGPQKLTEYVVTRWYRAPEIMLAARYSKAADVWSVGTIFAELLRRKPLFPGSDYLDQLRLIIGTLGTPTDAEVWYVTSERAKAFLAKNAGKPKVPWTSVVKRANPLALDLLEKMLKFNPSERITVEEALRHPYLSTLHCEEDEPCHPAGKYDFSFELGFRHEKANIQRLIFNEIKEFKKERERQQQQQHQQQQAAIIASSGAGSTAVEKKGSSADGVPAAAPSSLPPQAAHTLQPSQSQRIAAAAGSGSSFSSSSSSAAAATAASSAHQSRPSRKASLSAVAPAPSGGSSAMEMSPPSAPPAVLDPAAAASDGAIEMVSHQHHQQQHRPSSSASATTSAQRPVIPPLGLKAVAAAASNAASASATSSGAGDVDAASVSVDPAQQHYQHRQSQSQTDRPRGANDSTGGSGDFAGPGGAGPSHPSGAATQRSPVLLGVTKSAERLRRSQSSATLRGIANAAAASTSALAGPAGPGTAVPLAYHQYPSANGIGPGSSRGGTGGAAGGAGGALPALPSHRSTGRTGGGGNNTYRDNPLGSPPPRMSARGGAPLGGGDSARRDPVLPPETSADPHSDGGTGGTASLPSISGNNGASGGGGSGGGVLKSLFGILHRGGNKQ